MANSRIGRDLLIEKVGTALKLKTRRDAARIVGTVVECLESLLIDHMEEDGFAVKLDKFGKFTIRHRPPSKRRIPFTGETKITDGKRKIKFVTLGILRKGEKVAPSHRVEAPAIPAPAPAPSIVPDTIATSVQST